MANLIKKEEQNKQTNLIKKEDQNKQTNLIMKEEQNKKRPMTNFTCTRCQSTFNSKYKLKKNVTAQHIEKEVDIIESPPRKTAR